LDGGVRGIFRGGEYVKRRITMSFWRRCEKDKGKLFKDKPFLFVRGRGFSDGLKTQKNLSLRF